MYESGQRVIKCTNIKDKTSITFTEKGFDPFLLVSASGIYDTKNKIYKSDNTVVDGAEYLGSVMSFRNIVLVLKDIDNYDENREEIDKIFQTGQIGTLIVWDGEHERCIDYYTESVTSTAKVTQRLTTISLICPDPHFYDPYDHVLKIASVMDNFQWPHEFLEEGEEFSYFNPNRMAVIENNAAEEYTGLTIMVTATYDVVNPSVVKVETQETIQIGDTNNPFTLGIGDVLTITTHTGNKNVTLTHMGVTTDINYRMTYDSVFFQLTRGVNTIGYTANNGNDNMMLKILYKDRFMRA